MKEIKGLPSVSDFLAENKLSTASRRSVLKRVDAVIAELGYSWENLTERLQWVHIINRLGYTSPSLIARVKGVSKAYIEWLDEQGYSIPDAVTGATFSYGTEIKTDLNFYFKDFNHLVEVTVEGMKYHIRSYITLLPARVACCLAWYGFTTEDCLSLLLDYTIIADRNGNTDIKSEDEAASVTFGIPNGVTHGLGNCPITNPEFAKMVYQLKHRIHVLPRERKNADSEFLFCGNDGQRMHPESLNVSKNRWIAKVKEVSGHSFNISLIQKCAAWYKVSRAVSDKELPPYFDISYMPTFESALGIKYDMRADFEADFARYMSYRNWIAANP